MWQLAARLVGVLLLGGLLAACGPEFVPVGLGSDAGAGMTGTGGNGTGGTNAGGTSGSGVGGGQAGGGVGGGHAGSAPSCLPISPGDSFPAGAVLDDFSGPPLATGWSGMRDHFAVVESVLAHQSGHGGDDSEILLSPGRCATQEAWVTLTVIDTTAASIGLQMKARGDYNCEQLEVNYRPATQTIVVETCTDGAWSTLLGEYYAPELVPGSRLGARVFSSGSVEVYVNDALVLSETLSNWVYNDAVGMIGLAVFLGDGLARFDDFGGG